jgi:PKD repeat protein
MTERPALVWLKNSYFTNQNKAPKAYWTNTSSNLKIDFTSKSFDTQGGSIASYLWNFGDGSTSTAQNPSHNYLAFGNYTVSLTVTDNGNLQNTFTDVLVVTLNTGNWNVPTAYCK